MDYLFCLPSRERENLREKLMTNEKPIEETRQERREKKLRKKREKMPQHGKSLARIYKDAVLKKLKGK